MSKKKKVYRVAIISDLGPEKYLCTGKSKIEVKNNFKNYSYVSVKRLKNIYSTRDICESVYMFI